MAAIPPWSQQPEVTDEETELMEMPAFRRVAWAVPVAVASWTFFFFVDPASTALLPACPFHTITGLYCPGCGATRALHQLAHAHFTAAMRMNALAVCALPLALMLTLDSKPSRAPGWGRWAIFWSVVGFGVLRNIPIYPLRLLAP